jgi:hypothetical protein
MYFTLPLLPWISPLLDTDFALFSVDCLDLLEVSTLSVTRSPLIYKDLPDGMLALRFAVWCVRT